MFEPYDSEEVTINKGTFVLSIDLEMTWGVWDYATAAAEEIAIEKERAIVEELLELLRQYGIRATWATVGALFDTGHSGREQKKEAWYAPELVEKIRDDIVDHEVATHSYEHVYFREISRDRAAADLKQARRVHGHNRHPFNSIVFPRNQVAHLDVVQNSGIRVFRSVDAGILGWSSRHAPKLRPGLNLLSKMIPTPAPTVLPRRHSNGLVELPSSLLLLGRNGFRRIVNPSVMKAKINSSLLVAAARRRIFHLWFHPSNFYHQTKNQFAILESGLRTVAKMRDNGTLDVNTMDDFGSK